MRLRFCGTTFVETAINKAHECMYVSIVEISETICVDALCNVKRGKTFLKVTEIRAILKYALKFTKYILNPVIPTRLREICQTRPVMVRLSGHLL